MRFTRYTDYAIRVMLHLSVSQDRLVSIAEIAKAYDISHNHLMKVVQDLVSVGFVSSVRGRNGGLRIGRPPEDINFGALVRHTEDGFEMVDCTGCAVRPACAAPPVLAEAVSAFLAVLDRYTIADLIRDRSMARMVLDEWSARPA
ncbi:Rrf2 family transcriptional regulator [Granulibacter bethesdensis]|nr:Rrf2 family transcriptional regulator [Granulibacter bethesdensis]